MLLSDNRLPQIVKESVSSAIRNPNKEDFDATGSEYCFTFVHPDGSVSIGNGVISWNTDNALDEFKHKYEMRQIKTFFDDDLFSECMLHEFISTDRLGKTFKNGYSSITVPLFVGSNEELPTGCVMMNALKPEDVDHYYRERTFDIIDALLEYTEPMRITVNGVEYDALFYDSRLSPEQREELGTMKSVHIYETRHDDNGNWCDPVTVRKEGIHVVVNYCGVIFTIEEIPFPDDDEINIDGVEALIYKNRPGGEEDE